MAKYTDARYPEKVNDIIDNDGKIKAEALPVDPEPTVVNDYEGLVDFLNELGYDPEEKFDVDRTFYFKDANPADIERTLTSDIDAEPIMYIFLEENSYYDCCFNLVGSVKGQSNVGDEPTCFSGYIPIEIQAEQDMETGGMRIIVHFSREYLNLTGGLVSGTLRIKTIGENTGE